MDTRVDNLAATGLVVSMCLVLMCISLMVKVTKQEKQIAEVQDRIEIINKRIGK